MKKCSACQKEIDDNAKKCPHCQSDLRNWFVKHPFVTVILVIIAFGIANSGGNSKQTYKNSQTTQSIDQKTTPQVTPIQQSPINLTGKGNQATKTFRLEEGLRRFTIKYTGTSNFVVKLLDKDGQAAGGSFGLDSLLVNEIGSYDGSKAVRIDKAGDYLLNIDSSGTWNITIE